MTAEKFAEFVNAIRPNSDPAVAVWLEWADELEEYDSSHGEKPAGSYKTSEIFLDEFAQKFSVIRELHGDAVAEKMIFLADIWRQAGASTISRRWKNPGYWRIFRIFCRRTAPP